MPFYPTANRDDGYDVTDYYSVDPRLGTLGDLAVFLRTARDRGIRVIADLVVNHTSDRHPWFLSAASDRDSPFRDWYVWRDEIPPGAPDDLVFPDKETSNWEWHEETGQYYLHRFYSHQPDLNIGNPWSERRSTRSSASGCNWACRAFASMPCPICWKPRAWTTPGTWTFTTGYATCAASFSAAAATRACWER